MGEKKPDFTLEDIQSHFSKSNLNDEELLKMENSERIEEMINVIERFVDEKCNDKYIKTSQLRNIYSKLLKIKDDNVKGVQLLRPKLMYVAARQKNREAKSIVLFLNDIIKKIRTKEQLRSFKMFFEAIVAYHKFYS